MFTFKPAVREGVGLIMLLAGASGSGKSYTAMRIAKGICGEKRFAVIDTEGGRALHYADQFAFDHGDLHEPFSPEAYTEAIVAADKAGYPVIIVDSASHSWAGSGGVLDMQEAELTRMAGDDWKKREACKMAAWIRPKQSHKRMVQTLLQVRAHIILCLRAEEKIEMTKGPDGKMQIAKKQSPTGLDGWMPICDKNLPYEATCSFLLMAAHPGVPLPIKLQEQHKAFFPTGQVITEESGKRIAEWAAGGVTAKAETPTPTPTPNAEGIDERALRNAIEAMYPAKEDRNSFVFTATEGKANSLPEAKERGLLVVLRKAVDAIQSPDGGEGQTE